jgi:hypothetical protein
MPGPIAPTRPQGKRGRLKEGQADKENEEEDRHQDHGGGNGQPEKEDDDRIGQRRFSV